jgi:hypothetical protein
MKRIRIETRCMLDYKCLKKATLIPHYSTGT